jgi:peptidoglycan/LPS O-acetylase OafA/YrhL
VPTQAQLRAGPDAPAASDKYFPELDGIRAIAISLVLAAHYELVPFTPGGFGVTLFFFLSGYLITTLFFAEYRRSGAISVKRFYARRWLRLMPSLLIFILVATIFYPVSRISVGSVPTPPSQILAALFYMTNYYLLVHPSALAAEVPLGICWSLAVEEHFYLIWPWLVRRTLRDPGLLCRLIAGLCLSVLAWRVFVRFGLHAPPEYTYMATDCRIDSILYGALLRALFESPWAKAVTKLFSSSSVRFLAAAALGATFAIRNDDFRETVRYSIQGLALMPFFTVLLDVRPPGLIRQALASPPMVLLGKLSYSIYLFHLLARTPGEVIFHSPFHPVTVASGLAITLGIALALHFGVEKPVAALRHGLRTPGSVRADPVAEPPLQPATARPPGCTRQTKEGGGPEDATLATG